MTGASSIYKFGQNNTAETSTWFSWTGGLDVDVCRSQIAGDGSAEWTFYSGDGYPKATHNGLGAENGGFPPNEALRLGLPAPLAALSGTVVAPAHCEVGGVRADSKTDQASCEAVAYCAVNGARNDNYPTQAACESTGVCRVNGTVDATKTTRDACVAVPNGVWYPPGVCKVNGTVDATKYTQATCEAVPNGVWYPGDWLTGTWIDGAKATPAKITLTASLLSQLNPEYGLNLSTDNGGHFVNVKPSGTGAPSVTILPAHLDKMTEQYDLQVSVDGGQHWTTYALPNTMTRNADLWVSAAQIATMDSHPYLDIAVTTIAGGTNIARIDASTIVGATEALRATALVAQLSSSVGSYNSAAPGALVTAAVSTDTRYPNGVYIRTRAQGSDVQLSVNWTGTAETATGSSLSKALYDLEALLEAPVGTLVHAVRMPNNDAPTSLQVTSETGGSNVNLIVKWGDDAGSRVSALGTAPSLDDLVAKINAKNGPPLPENYTGATAEKVGPTIVVSSVKTGSTATLRIRWGEATNQLLTATGTTADLGTKETRVYTYTWVLKEAGMEWESAPWTVTTMPSYDVYSDGSVTLTGFEAPSVLNANGWGPINGTLHYRIYRAVNGVYLYVDEKPAPLTSYTDKKRADQLGEELPSLLWTPPPATLTGMINLPNGMVAGFFGRELHFCEPYRPFAWPDIYAQVVDYPVVGLGRMDTTLAVLTKGVPYFIQGSAPDVAVMVKSDIEQACVSKRSIVSMGGAVFYAAPDGLMMLSSSGSDILTKDLMDRDTWQALTPSSIVAYGHDNKYVAFHPQTTIGGHVVSGFVVDLKSKQFVRHNFQATCGYNDLRTDQLYLVDGSGHLVKWDSGTLVTDGVWRSKLFGLPQISGFACAQVEAETYPVGCRLYRDGVEVVTALTNDVVTSRTPWRLEAQQGRDWQIELDVKYEIYNVAVAQSMSEIATT